MFLVTSTRKYIFQSEVRLASLKIVLKLNNILKDQKVFWRIKGLFIMKESKIQRKVE